MTEQEYKELNGYLNDIFLKLDKEDYFFVENIEAIKYLSDRYCTLIEQYNLDSNTNSKYLSFDEVYKISSEVIKTINPNYLNDFNNLIEKGELDFDYEEKYSDSHLYYKLSKEENLKLINIKRTYNYEEVKTLVHEFIHYTNSNSNSVKKHVLCEYLSISGEMFAEDYMLNNGVTYNEVNSIHRLKTTYERCANLSWIMDALIAYKNIGNLNKENLKFVQNNLIDIEDNELELQCQRLLISLRNKDEEIEYHEYFVLMCQYLLGTLLGFYTRNYVSKKDFSDMNDNINNGNLFVIDTLKKYNIDLEDDTVIDRIFQSIESYLNKINLKVIK